MDSLGILTDYRLVSREGAMAVSRALVLADSDCGARFQRHSAHLLETVKALLAPVHNASEHDFQGDELFLYPATGETEYLAGSM
jgi:hypothetical protein